MDIKINKDIAKEYPDDSWKGFSLGQLCYIAAAVVSGAAMICFLYFLMGVNIRFSVYGAFPVAAPIALLGFYRYAGMSCMEMLRNWLRLQKSSRLPYMAEEKPSKWEQVEEKKKRKGGRK